MSSEFSSLFSSLNDLTFLPEGCKNKSATPLNCFYKFSNLKLSPIPCVYI